MPEMNLWLDSYDDIFSDFDSRHYLKRRISEDFLHELHIEMKHMDHYADDMLLLLPAQQRNEDAEKIIKTSLVNFFKTQFNIHSNICRKKLNKGISFLISGILLMLFNSWLSYYRSESFFAVGLKVLLEPAGWFLLWIALDFLYYDHAELKKEKNFYRQLSEMHVHFKSS